MSIYRTDEWCKRFIETYKQYTLKPSTFHAYLGYAENITSDVPITELNSDDVQLMINQMYARGNSTSTIKHMLTILRQALTKAKQKGIINNLNALDFIEIPKRRSEAPTLTRSELQLICDNLKGETYEDLFRFLLLTGCRVGEAIALQWQDIDFFNGTIHFCNTDFKGELQPNKTSSADRFIKMSVTVKIMLKRLLRCQNGNVKRVFLNTLGVKCSYRSVLDSWKRYLKKLGISKECGLHTLRHAFVHNAIRNGIPVKVVSKWVGHSDISITLKHYDYIDETEIENCADVIDSLYGGGLHKKRELWLNSL